MVDNVDTPVLNIVVDGDTGKYRVREVERIVNRLKFIYDGKYNVISTYHGVSIRGENVTHLTISNACDLGGVIKALDDLICKD